MDDKMKKRLLMYLMQYGWRDEYEDDGNVNPYDYEREEDYLAAKAEFDNNMDED